MFERQNGSVTDYKEAVVRSRNAMKAVETLRAQVRSLTSLMPDELATLLNDLPSFCPLE